MAKIKVRVRVESSRSKWGPFWRLGMQFDKDWREAEIEESQLHLFKSDKFIEVLTEEEFKAKGAGEVSGPLSVSAPLPERDLNNPLEQLLGESEEEEEEPAESEEDNAHPDDHTTAPLNLKIF